MKNVCATYELGEGFTLECIQLDGWTVKLPPQFVIITAPRHAVYFLAAFLQKNKYPHSHIK